MPIIIAIVFGTLLFFGQSWFFSNHWQKNLKLSLQFEEKEIPCGESFTLKEIIRNEKRMVLPALQVKFRTTKTFLFSDTENGCLTDYYYRNDMFSVGGKQEICRLLQGKARERGYFTIDEASVVARDYFFSNKYAGKFPVQAGICVYPAKLNFSPFKQQFRQIMGEFSARLQLLEDPFCFRGIRPYQPYDSMKRINWKSSARNAELLVNTFDSSYSQEICILLNVKGFAIVNKTEIEEFSISIASTLAAEFLKAGIPTSLYSNGKDIESEEEITVEKGLGKQQQRSIDCALARLDLSKEPSSFLELAKRKYDRNKQFVQYIFISAEHTKEWLDYFTQIQKEFPDICQIVPEAEGEKWDLLPGMTGWEFEEFML